MTRHITRFRALLAANVLLVILSFALIAPQWLEDDDRFDFEGITIVGPDSADMEAAIAQLRKHPRVLVTPATPASPTVAVKPVKRPKPPIAGPDLMTGVWRCRSFAASPSS